MSNNLHISYDLLNPGQNYERVIERIKSLGPWAKIHLSYWYVKAPLTATQVVDNIKPLLDANDKIYVVDASNNNAAWNQLPENGSALIKDQWNR